MLDDYGYECWVTGEWASDVYEQVLVPDTVRVHISGWSTVTSKQMTRRKIVSSAPSKCHECGAVSLISTSDEEPFHPHPPYAHLQLTASAHFSQCTSCGMSWASLDQLKRSMESQHFALHQHLTTTKEST